MTTNGEKNMLKVCQFVCYFLFVIFVCSSCGTEGKKTPSISGGNDIPIMPTTASNEEATSFKEDNCLDSIVVGLDIEKNTINLQIKGTGDTKTYSFSGATSVYDRYDKLISISLLKIGEVVRAEFDSSTNKVTKISALKDEWEILQVTNFNIDKENKVISYGSKKYTYTDNIVVIADKKKIKIDKLESVDTVILKGYDKQIDSIIVLSGHGYVRLEHTAYFEGGYVDIGAKIVKVITENMVIPVPEGKYTLMVTKDETTGSKDIEVIVDEEMQVNLTEFQDEAVRYGSVKFIIKPNNAVLKIDGKVKKAGEIIDLSYGTHKVVISTNGYNSYSDIINVQEMYKEYNISLTEDGNLTGTGNEESENGVTSSLGETTTKSSTNSVDQTTSKNSSKATTKSLAEEIRDELKEDETTTYDWYSMVSGLFN